MAYELEIQQKMYKFRQIKPDRKVQTNFRIIGKRKRPWGGDYSLTIKKKQFLKKLYLMNFVFYVDKFYNFFNKKL